jgi:hypothetical protein
MAWSALIPAALLLQIYRLVTKQYCLLSHLLFASLVSTLAAEWVLLSARDARYLLPLSAPLVILAGVELADLVDRRRLGGRIAFAMTATVLLLGAVSMNEFQSFSFLWPNPQLRLTESARLRRVVSLLEAHGVRHVFSMNGLLQWQLMLYSDETVLARGTDGIDRYPPYLNAVDRALAQGEPVAVVGYTNDSGAPGCQAVPICTGGLERIVAKPEQILTVDNKYFVYVGADKALIAKLGFWLPD